jgi:hypothetical protein
MKMVHFKKYYRRLSKKSLLLSFIKNTEKNEKNKNGNNPFQKNVDTKQSVFDRKHVLN